MRLAEFNKPVTIRRSERLQMAEHKRAISTSAAGLRLITYGDFDLG